LLIKYWNGKVYELKKEEILVKKIKTLFIVLFIGLFLVSCANEANNEDAVTLSMWNRYPGNHEFMEEFVRDFEDEHPEIKIDLERIPDDTMEVAYQTAASDGSFPDIFTHGVIPLYEFVELGLAKNLNELISEDDRERFHPGTFQENVYTYNDEIYALPVVNSPNHGTWMMHYNKEVLDKHDISEDEIPQTWEELIKVGNHIYENSDGNDYGLIFYNDWAVTPFVEQQATAISPEIPLNINYITGEPDYNNQGNIETIEFLKTLLDENIMHPASIEVNAHEAEAQFAAGNAAFFIGGNWISSHLINNNDFENFGVAKMPTKNGDPVYHPAGGETDGLMVSENTEHWEEVKVFMEYALENFEREVSIPEGASQPATTDVEFEAPFPQYEVMDELMTEYSLPVPEPTERSRDTIEFEIDFENQMANHSMEQIIVGYLTEEIDDIESVLSEADQEAKEIFEDLLEEYEDVTREYFQFPNWEPFTPYSTEDYEELEE